MTKTMLFFIEEGKQFIRIDMILPLYTRGSYSRPLLSSSTTNMSTWRNYLFTWRYPLYNFVATSEANPNI